MMIREAPSRPSPTVNMPATPPVRKATVRASAMLPSRAAAAVRTLPRVASVMPMYPVRPEATQPRMNATVRHGPGRGERQCRRLIRPQDLGRREEHDRRHRHDDDGDGAELPLQIRRGTVLDGLRDLPHLRRALVGGQHGSRQVERRRRGPAAPPPRTAGGRPTRRLGVRTPASRLRLRTLRDPIGLLELGAATLPRRRCRDPGPDGPGRTARFQPAVGGAETTEAELARKADRSPHSNGAHVAGDGRPGQASTGFRSSSSRWAVSGYHSRTIATTATWPSASIPRTRPCDQSRSRRLPMTSSR